MPLIKPILQKSPIQKLQSLLDNVINVDGKKVRAKAEPEQMAESNMFQLFYDGEDENIKVGKHTDAGFYSIGIQVTARHNNYEKSRRMAYSALQYIKRNRLTQSDISFRIGESAPSFLGKDDTGANVWGFNIKALGDH